MNVLVLLAGICDPKWPYGAAQPRILSPFDESALEVALQLRDADPTVSLRAVLVSDATDEALARTVLGLRPDSLLRLDDRPGQAWDIVGLAIRIKLLIDQQAVPPDLVLTGRQFGDCDDGALPACLASALGWRHVALIQRLEARARGFMASRERAGVLERICVAAPLVASVTNDRGNRLRHALMKNVMNAKRAAIASTPPVDQGSASRVALLRCKAAPAPQRAQACRILQGTVEERVAELADFLGAWSPAP